MMIERVKSTLACLVFALCSSAQATTIDLSGTVVASACTVDAGSKNQTVRFDQARAVNFSRVGATGEWQDFSLTLSSCPSSTTRVQATLTGDSDSDDQTKFANSSGDATGMAMQIMTRDHLTEISPAGSITVDVDRTTHNAQFPLAARLYTPTGTVTAGEFNTTVQFTFTYQ
ncbi:TPA: fimbrial protein [Enterobacter kobei]|uniref:fimbrial protein n=2 Tax=Enterobacteriaceae TaxID=543 RepID=UPI001EDA7ACE|nr:fimbrial protein [Enterobacter kobei]MCM7094772.1 type 1 fimbrial protein [Enterobacter kobei]MCM7478748.1 type 1 fimbrial protein [Enterobacter kobei]MEB6373068.1 type 1 fimbrial protein [Enterobacter kobei]